MRTGGGVVPRGGSRLAWAGRAVFGLVIVGLVTYLVVVGLDKADKIASGISLIVALCALAAPYLLPSPSLGESASRRGDAGRRTDTGPHPLGRGIGSVVAGHTEPTFAAGGGISITGPVIGNITTMSSPPPQPGTVSWPVLVGAIPAVASAFQARRISTGGSPQPGPVPLGWC